MNELPKYLSENLTHLSEMLITEAPSEYKHVVAMMYTFDSQKQDPEIIDSILRDFSLKCAKLIEEFTVDTIPQSLCLYDLFYKRYGIDNPGDPSVNGECIYSEIPDICYRQYINDYLTSKRTPETLSRIFGGGEFPIVKIWKGYHESTETWCVTFNIMR